MHRIFILVVFAVILALPGYSEAQSTTTARGMTLDARVKDMPHLKMGPFVRLRDGAILTVEGTDALISNDEGETWERHPIFSEPGKFIISNERAIYRTREGHVIVAFMNLAERKWTWSDELGDAPGARLPTWVVLSMDDGRTWQPPQKMHDAWTGAVRDMIETREGNIIFTAMQMRHDPGRHTAITYISEDRGRTWQPSNVIDLGGAGHHGGVSEPTIEQLNDGRLLMLVRTNWMQLWRAESADGGRTWHPYGPSGIPASSAPAMLKRLQSGRLLLVWNRPYPQGASSYPLTGGDRRSTATRVSNHRGELSIAFSDDDAKTWSAPIVIAARPKSSLAYPYVFEVQPGVLWITSMQGDVRLQLKEQDFISGTAAQAAASPIRVACVGDSITFGHSIARREHDSYPAQLAKLLGDGWIVENFGRNGATVLVEGTRPYIKQPECRSAMAFKPDIVIIKLGTNDSVPANWARQNAFAGDLAALIQQFRDLPSKPRVFVCTPVPAWLDHDDPRWINLQQIVPRIREVAAAERAPLIELNDVEAFPADLYADGVHPRKEGAARIADRVHQAIVASTRN